MPLAAMLPLKKRQKNDALDVFVHVTQAIFAASFWQFSYKPLKHNGH
jgi:hypothetical protein